MNPTLKAIIKLPLAMLIAYQDRIDERARQNAIGKAMAERYIVSPKVNWNDPFPSKDTHQDDDRSMYAVLADWVKDKITEIEDHDRSRQSVGV